MESSPQPAPSAKRTKASLPQPPPDQNFQDALETIDELPTTINDDKYDSSSYPCLISSIKYLFSSLSTLLTTNTHQMICNLAAWPHMFNDEKFFGELCPWSSTYPKQNIELAANGNTTPIKGVGTISFLLNKKYPVKLHNALFVPTLTTSLYCIPEHMKYSGCAQFSGSNKYFLSYPTFIVNALVQDEKIIDIDPLPKNI